MLFLGLLVFILGLITGSFLNVVICRYNTGLSISRGRSKCFQCGQVLSWYELIPLFSFIIQWRRCRQCRSLISWQYPLVEFLTGLLFLGVWQLDLYLPLTLIYLAIMSVLVVILAYDLRHKIIPDGPVYLFIVLSLAAALLASGTSYILAAALFFVVFWAFWYFSGGRWMGFGDAKLVVGLGLLLGLTQGTTALFISFWSGALVGLSLILWGRLFGKRASLTIKSEIPFAPFIILGLILTLFLDLNVLAF